MATGNQSKEGLFELMFDHMKNNNMTSRHASQIAIAIIDAIPNEVREDKNHLVIYLDNLGQSLIQTSKEINTTP